MSDQDKVKFKTLSKIALRPNSKKPAFKGWNKPEQQRQYINNKVYNIGIPTGAINNLLGLDIDIKNNGKEEFKKYIDRYGEPQTVKQKTPSGGEHYFFLFGSSDINDDYIIKKYLINKGIDIRAEGGFMCSHPSTIDGGKYEYERSFNDYKVLEMPHNLILWLLEGVNINDNKAPNKYKAELQFNITDNEIRKIIYQLPSNYYNNYSDWLILLTVLKNLNKFDIFDEFSKKGENYNYNNNIALWNANEGKIDINYLLFILNKDKQIKDKKIKTNELKNCFKPYEPIELDISNIKQNVMNNKFLFDKTYNDNQYDYKTGTGKTTATAKHIKQYITENEDTKILCIVTRKSLTNQHIKTFKDEDIILMNYQR